MGFHQFATRGLLSFAVLYLLRSYLGNHGNGTSFWAFGFYLATSNSLVGFARLGLINEFFIGLSGFEAELKWLMVNT